MRIKTLTTYDVYNYGASLQAYALQKFLSDLHHNVEIINYQPEYLRRKYDYKWVNPESPFHKYKLSRVIYRVLKCIQRQTTLGRKRRFDEFNHHILRETPQQYLSYEALCENPPEADLYLVGIDQIWNVLYEAGRDPAFYLEFVTKGRKASYAASFSYLDIDADNLARIASSLSSFSHVSIREHQGLDILEKIGICGKWVLDPVFLISNEKWRQLMVPFKKEHPYLLIYDFEGNSDLKSFAKEYAKKHGLRIVCIVDTYPYAFADKNYKAAGPQEFLTLLYNCDAFISNSFHGTAFSILFHKPVYAFSRHRHKVNSRMQSLLDLFEINECLDPTAEIEFDWEGIDAIRERELDKSKAFLESVIGNVNR